MSEVYSGFKFEIGDHLQTKKPNGWKPQKAIWTTKGDGDGRVRLHVVQRVYQECPGGIQLHYDCRVIHGEGSMSTQLQQFNEIEVEAWQPQTEKDAD